MVESKLAMLSVEFTPEKISLSIELVPVKEQLFDEPINSTASKLDAVANYARSTFAVRTSTHEPKTEGRADKPRELPEAKLIKKGNARAIEVFEGELARAKNEKNPVMIKRAEEALARAKEKIRRTTEKMEA